MRSKYPVHGIDIVWFRCFRARFPLGHVIWQSAFIKNRSLNNSVHPVYLFTLWNRCTSILHFSAIFLPLNWQRKIKSTLCFSLSLSLYPIISLRMFSIPLCCILFHIEFSVAIVYITSSSVNSFIVYAVALVLARFAIVILHIVKLNHCWQFNKHFSRNNNNAKYFPSCWCAHYIII